MYKRVRYEKRNGRERLKNSEKSGGEERRSYVPARKKHNPLLIGAIAGGAVLLLIIIIAVSSSSSGTESGRVSEAPAENLQQDERKYKELWEQASADQEYADRLARDDNQVEADRYYRNAIEKLDSALAIVKPLAERYPETKYSIEEQQIERQLGDIKSRAGFNVGR